MPTSSISDNVNFDHLVKMISAGSFISITIFPFVIRKHLLGVDP